MHALCNETLSEDLAYQPAFVGAISALLLKSLLGGLKGCSQPTASWGFMGYILCVVLLWWGLSQASH